MGYRIKTVSELTGIPKNTLVAWERRYGILNPERLDNGYRRYTDADVAVLQQLKSAMADGLRISEAVELVRQGRQPHNPPERSRARVAESDLDAFAPARDELLDCLSRFARSEAERVVGRLVGLPYERIIDLVYYPLLKEVGDRWEAGEMSVAQEHFVSAFVRDQLSAMLLQVGSGPKDGLHVVCTTFPGEQHELGVLGLAVSLALRGCRVTYLGADLPASELCRFGRRYRPAAICCSVLIPLEQATLSAYVEELRGGLDAQTRIILGGTGVAGLRCEEEGVELLQDWRALDLH